MSTFWTPSGEFSSDRRSAEKHWRERDRVEAAHTGFRPEWQAAGFENWLIDNQSFFDQIGRSIGGSPIIMSQMIARLRREHALRSDASYNEISMRDYLAGAIGNVERVCRRLGMPIHGTVVTGMFPHLGVELGIAPVSWLDDISILRATSGFFTFYNNIYKLLAHTLLYNGDTLILNREMIKIRLGSDANLIRCWTLVFAEFAAYGMLSPTGVRVEPPIGPAKKTYLDLLGATDFFVVAHEYAHHFRRHNADQSGSDAASTQKEFEADSFSFFLSQSWQPVNPFAASGVGAVISIGAHTLLMRSKSILSTGVDELRMSGSHPTPRERLRALAHTDTYLPHEYRIWAGIMRECVGKILLMVWRFVLPELRKFYANQQYRPIDLTQQAANGWLPRQ